MSLPIYDSTLVETMEKHKCPSCNTMNWIALGDLEDFTQPDIDGIECFTCGFQWLTCPDPLVYEGRSFESLNIKKGKLGWL